MANTNEHVNGLQHNLKRIYTDIAELMEREMDQRRAAQRAAAAGGEKLKAGDYVFYKLPPRNVRAHTGQSFRLSARSYPKVYRVRRMAGPQGAVLEDPDTGRDDIGFAQPIHVEHLTPFEFCELDEPYQTTDGKPPRLEMKETDGAWKLNDVVAQTVTGAVRLLSPIDGATKVVDLVREECRWVG